MFESRITSGGTEKLRGWEKLCAKTVAWSYDMEGHANMCVESYHELANKKRLNSCTKSELHVRTTITSREKNWNSWRSVKKFAQRGTNVKT